jgi:hypothetical protein
MGSTSRSRRGRGTDLAVVAGLVGAGYVVVLAFVERSWMDVAPAFALLTLPAVAYLAWRTPMPWPRLALGTVVFGAGFGFFFEVFQESGDSYSVLARSLPRLVGVVPGDSVVAHMLMTLLTLTFYEHFVLRADGPDAGRRTAGLSRRARHGAALGAGMVVAVVVVHAVEASWVDVGYSYAVLGTAAIVPPVLLALRRPAWLRQLALLVPAFLVYYLVMEVVAVRHDWWVYPADHYLGWVTLPVPGGDVRFPFEELFFWMTLYAAALASYYEIFLLPKAAEAGRTPATPPSDKRLPSAEKPEKGPPSAIATGS